MEKSTENNKKEEESVLGKTLKSQWNLWKSTVEELELQLTLGKAEALDDLEDFKKKFDGFLHDKKSTAIELLKKGKEFASEKEQELLQDIDELKVQLALGKAETKDAFEAQKKTISEKLHKVESTLKASAGDLDDEFDEQFTKLKTKLDTLRVQFELGKYESRDALEQKKKDLKTSMGEFKIKMDNVTEEQKEKGEGFMDEMSESFNHMKKAFKDLF